MSRNVQTEKPSFLKKLGFFLLFEQESPAILKAWEKVPRFLPLLEVTGRQQQT